MSRLTVSHQEIAPEASQWLVAGAIARNGFLPNLTGVLASVPQALRTCMTVSGTNAGTSLALAGRDVSACRPRHDHAEVTRARSLATAKAPSCRSSRVGAAHWADPANPTDNAR